MKTKIHSELAPAAIGPYSQAIRYGQTVYLSGQIPLDPQTMQLVSGDIASQAKQVFANLREVAIASGATLNEVLKLTIYLTDLATFPIVNEIMTAFFKEPYPARVTIQVSALPKGAQIEIDAVIGITGS